MSCSSNQAGHSPAKSPGTGSASVVLEWMFLTEVPALTNPIHWSPALSRDCEPQELKSQRQASLQQHLFMEN